MKIFYSLLRSIRLLQVLAVLALSISYTTLPRIVFAVNDWQALPSGTVSRIAFGSCAMQNKAQPIWKTISKQNPDLFLFIGDNIYGDYDGKKAFIPSEHTLRRDWNLLANEPNFRAFRQQIPVMATWDNHDYGKYNGGAEFELKEISKKVFLDFLNEPENSVRRLSPGVYDAKIFGPSGRRVQIILLDLRYFKGPFIKDKRSKKQRQAAGLTGSMGTYTPNSDPNVSLLGKSQWAWLETQLKKPAELRLIISSTQVIADDKGMEEWGNYPLERQRLFDLIIKTKANGVLILSGNVHFAELSKLNQFPYPLLDFTSSGLTHSSGKYSRVKNRYRLRGPFGEQNFGMVEINWETVASPHITLKAIGMDGATNFSYRLSLKSLHL